MRYKVVIPSRYGSTRLPAKPLLEIAGTPMILHVVARARESGAEHVVVATDHQAIFDLVAGHGIDVVMTSPEHRSGTDRIAEVAEHFQWPDDEIVVNVQGDEPLIDPALIHSVAQSLFEHSSAQMATASYPLVSIEEFANPNVVKVVTMADGAALYFSRAGIPFARDERDAQANIIANASRHVGIYAYRVAFLHAYVKLPPAQIEITESLEQLRALWYGYRIHVHQASGQHVTGVDTQKDLEIVEHLLRKAQPSIL